jgi:hypothetical protein
LAIVCTSFASINPDNRDRGKPFIQDMSISLAAPSNRPRRRPSSSAVFGLAGTGEPFVGRTLSDGMNQMTIESVQVGTTTDVTNE